MSDPTRTTSGGSVIAPLTAPAYLTSEVSDWLALLKPRVITLVVFTGAVGLVLAPGHLHPVLAFTAVLCIAVAAGASGAINMWFDRDIDAVMRRTMGRPIPSGRIAASGALGFGVVLAVASVLMMYLATNLAASVVLALSILFYVFVYTIWLKRRTPQNIVIGGAAGAFPPVIGWAAVTGNVDIFPILLFAIIFFWTPPHFWALSLYAHSDYERAGVPMLPVANGAKTTRWHVLGYSVVLVASSLLPWLAGYTGPIYGAGALLLGAGFVVAAIRVVMDRQDQTGRSLTKDRPARQAFKYSLLYLFALFALLAVDHWAW